MNDIQLFQYEGKQIRTVTVRDEPWFVLRDICDVLEIVNTADVARRLDEDERGVDSIDTLGGRQAFVVVSESGLYNVILRSDKPEAKPFRKWITSDVLPSIRKHGMYATDNALEAMLSDPDTMIRTLTALKQERAQRIAAEATLQIQAPKVLFADAVAGSHDSINVGAMAKLLKKNSYDIGQNRFYEWLRENGYCMKEEGRSYNRPTQRSMDLKVMEIKESTRVSASGTSHIDAVTLITGKGQIYFLNKLIPQRELAGVQA